MCSFLIYFIVSIFCVSLQPVNIFCSNPAFKHLVGLFALCCPCMSGAGPAPELLE